MSKKRGIFGWYFSSNLLVRIMAGLILGAVFGIIFKEADGAIRFLTPFGELFIRLLKMIVEPVIIFSLIMGTASIAPSRLGRVGIKILAFYVTTSIFAIVIGLLAGNILHPGLGMDLSGSKGVSVELKAPSVLSTLLSIIPTNPFGAFAAGDVLPTIAFCIFFGLSLAFLRESADKRIRDASATVYRFFEGAAEVIYKVVGWIMQYAPIGVFALIFVVFSKQGATAFGPLVQVTAAVYVGLLAQLILVYGGLAFLFGLGPVKFFKKVRAPMLTAFVTRSSNGTLPISMETADKLMGISRGVYGFTLPLGATVNMDGTTIYLGVCAIFIANAIGMPLTLHQQGIVILTAVLASIGTAGVPGAGAIMLLMVLDSVGLSTTANAGVALAYGMILGVDAVLDMGRTSMNVVGDMIGTAIVGKLEHEMNMDVWNKK